MPRKSNLVLNQQQEQDLVKFAIQRLKSLRADNDRRIKTDKASWAAYENDANARAKAAGTIFELKNIHLPITALIVEHFMARAEEEVADQPPFFKFKPLGSNDDQTAREYNSYFNWKLDTKGEAHRSLKDSMLPIFIQQAHILKATFKDDARDWIDQDREILYDLNTGQPVEIFNHGPIIKGEDEFVAVPDMAAARPPDMPAEEAWQPPARQHLKADPTFVLDEKSHEWRKPPDGIRRSEVIYRGAKSVPVDYDAFLCPSNVRTIEEADMVAEGYDRGLDWFRSMWQEGREWAQWSNLESEYRSGDATEKTETERKTESKGDLTFDLLNPKRKVVECWIRRDVLGWGKPQEFVLFLDEEKERAVFYEFQAKVCEDFKRPYTSIAIGRTKYWWGKSLPEKIEQYQTEADKQFNGELLRNAQASNPIKGGDPTALVEEPTELRFDPLKYYKVKPNRSIKEAFDYIGLPQHIDSKTHELLEFIIYMVQLWLGVSSIAQGDYGDAPENATAYGIEKTIHEASKINKRWIRRIIDDFEAHLTKLVLIEVATTKENAQEIFLFVDGDQSRMAVMTAQKKRTVLANVQLVMSQRQDAQKVERAKTALEVQDRYFAELDPLRKVAMRPMLCDILISLDYKDVDRLLPMPPAQELATALMIKATTPPGAVAPTSPEKPAAPGAST